MLKSLNVQNYALIDSLQLEFGNGLNIITGETGAGKSVLMGALGLLLGDRTDTSALLDKSRKCIISGVFKSSDKSSEFLKSSELDDDKEIVIHREINKDGKSRAFINDTPVNLSQLRELGDLLVDIHSQHETLLLNKSGFQLSVVDAFAGNAPALIEFSRVFKDYKNLSSELFSLRQEEQKLRTDQDYLQFQFNELDEVKLIQGEQEKLEEESSSLSHAGEIRENIDILSNEFANAENSLLSRLNSAINVVGGLAKFSSQFDDCTNRLKAVQIELKDIEYELEQAADKISMDPKRLESVNDRLSQIYRLQQKHRIDTVDGLIQLYESIKNKLMSFSSLEESIQKKNIEVEKRFQEVKKIAEKLSLARRKVLPEIESKIKKLLADLAMPEAVLKIELVQVDEESISFTGRDSVRFLFSANKGIPYSDISKVASGGELSRLMLSLKASVAKLIDLPTIVFDEIDTGVSGETAFKIGKVMQELSKSHQLVSITHLPQIASRGEDHFFVYKQVTGKKTFTHVRKLSSDDRIVEIARMLSGDKPTAVAMQNAKELLKN